jgi:hypothetical protein
MPEYQFNSDVEISLATQIKEYLEKSGVYHKHIGINGKLNASFYKKINGYFHFKYKKRVGDTQFANVKFVMNNPETEMYVGLMLLQEFRYFGNATNRNSYLRSNYLTGKSLNDYVNVNALLNPMREEYLDNLKFINQTITFKNNVKYVMNPNTNRRIIAGGATYRKIYGKMILRSASIKDLTLNTIEYPIKGNCVFSYISQTYGAEIAKKYIGENPTYKDILKVAISIGFTFKVDMITRKRLFTHECNKEDQIPLHIIISKGHMYVLQNHEVKSRKEIELPIDANFNEIEDEHEKRFIITDENQFEQIINSIKKEYILTHYNDNHITFKTNEIELIEDYDKIVEMKEAHNKYTNNIFSIVESCIGLLGYMNSEMYDIFNLIKCNTIRTYTKYSDENDVLLEDFYTVMIDGNSQYLSSLYYDIEYPIPSLDNYEEKYDGEGIRPGGFYYCELNNHDMINHPGDSWYYYPIVNFLMSRKLIKKIRRQFICKTEKIDHIYLPSVTGDKKNNKLKTIIEKGDLRNYFGYLLKENTSISYNYDNVGKIELNDNLFEDINESDLLKNVYGNDCYIDEKQNVTISHHYRKTKTGLMAWIAIVQISNMSLFLMNEKVHELNPGCILTKIRTDSLSYLFKDDDYNLPKKDIDPKQFKKYKIVKKEDNRTCKDKKIYYIKDAKKMNNYESKDDESIGFKLSPLITNDIKNEVNNYDDKDLKIVLDKYESFQLHGLAGFGKSHQLQHTILPYLKKHKMKYIVSSTTKEQRNDLQNKIEEKVLTIQSIFTDYSSVLEIKEFFEDIDYLIIDEAVQLTQDHLKRLEYIKQEHKVNIIVLVDRYQCVYGYNEGQPWIVSNFAIKLFDSNIVTIQKHDFIRYSNKIYNILMYMIDNWNDKPKVIKYLREKIITVNKFPAINVAYTHTTCDIINKCKESVKKLKCGLHWYQKCAFKARMRNDKMNPVCITVHKAQGQTLTDVFCIHDVDKAPMDVLFTAISRAKKLSQIMLAI